MGQFNFMGQKLLYAVLLVYAVVSQAQAQTAQKIAKKAFRSTVLLVMEDANGQPLALGSGFFVREGEIASNLHVVEGASRGYAKLVGQEAKLNIQGITAIDAKRDLVILKVFAKTLPVLALGDSEAAQVGEQIYAVGNPKGLEGTFSQGIISSVRNLGTDKLLQITAPISPGSSGGPVLNAKAEVIGVSVATFKGGQNLNFAIPSAYLKELLEKTGSVKPLASINPTKPKSSLVKNIGKSSTEGVIVSHLAITNPLPQQTTSPFSEADIEDMRKRLRVLQEYFKQTPKRPIAMDKSIDPFGTSPGRGDAYDSNLKELAIITQFLEAAARAQRSSVRTHETQGRQVHFSLKNLLREPVENIHYLIVFYDQYGNAVDSSYGFTLGPIPAGLAKRETGGLIRQDVSHMIKNPSEQIEVRVLDFEIVQ